MNETLTQEDTRASYHALYTKYQRVIAHRIHVMLPCPEQAEDVCQEVWLKVWRAWPPRDDSALYSWLCHIAHNAACDALRTNQHPLRQTVPLTSPIRGEDGACYEEARADLLTLPTSEEMLDNRDLFLMLPPAQRTLLGMWAVGYRYEEITAHFGYRDTRDTYNHMAHTRARLRRWQSAGKRRKAGKTA